MTRADFHLVYDRYRAYRKAQGWPCPSETDLWDWEGYKLIALAADKAAAKLEREKGKK